MSRVVVPITPMVVNGAIPVAVGVAINPAVGAIVAAGGDTQRLVIWARNTAASTLPVTIRAGAAPLAFARGQGDLVESLTQNAERFFTIESARFAQADGSIHVDFGGGMTGTIAAYRLPKL